jgi:hypothetical protein
MTAWQPDDIARARLGALAVQPDRELSVDHVEQLVLVGTASCDLTPAGAAGDVRLGSAFSGLACARSRRASVSVAAAGQRCLRFRLCCLGGPRHETDQAHPAHPRSIRNRLRETYPLRVGRPGICVPVPLLLQPVVKDATGGWSGAKRKRYVSDSDVTPPLGGCHGNGQRLHPACAAPAESVITWPVSS